MKSILYKSRKEKKVAQRRVIPIDIGTKPNENF